MFPLRRCMMQKKCYILGSYSRDGKQIMITHIIDSLNAKNILSEAFGTSKGIIDYIGDYRYSGEKPESYNATSLEIIASKGLFKTICPNMVRDAVIILEQMI